MSCDYHAIGLAVLVKLKHQELEREAERYRLAARARASPVEVVPRTRHANPMDRVLASILFMDVEESTQHLVRWGDAAWRDTLDQLYGSARQQIVTFRGRNVSMIGDEIMAAFNSPMRAIRCAEAIQRDAMALGLRLRAGVHIGEVEQSGDHLRGIAVHIAARIAALAKGNEILVSATVRDIVAGSGLSFADRGARVLKGVPDPRRVFSVAQR